MRLTVFCLASALVAMTLNAGDVETTRKMMQGTWYCSSTDMTHRFEFNHDGTFTWWSYVPTQNKQRKWSADFIEPQKYTFNSPLEIQAGMSKLVIQSLKTKAFNFTWGSNVYLCTRTPPPGDTAESRAAAAAAENKGKQAFLGRWVSVDQTQYVEFLANDVCILGHLEGGKWMTSKEKSFVYHEGKDIGCGAGGMYSLQGSSTLIFDIGMGGAPAIKYYRGPQNRHEVVPILTVPLAQRILSQKINMPTISNTLSTCHACYDPSDKEDNDNAPVVTTYSEPLSQLLMKSGYVRASGDRQVFTAKAKRSKYYQASEGLAGFRFANFRNPKILTSGIADPNHVPIEYDSVPTDLTVGVFGGVKQVKSVASFSYESGAWTLCIGCRR